MHLDGKPELCDQGNVRLTLEKCAGNQWWRSPGSSSRLLARWRDRRAAAAARRGCTGSGCTALAAAAVSAAAAGLATVLAADGSAASAWSAAAFMRSSCACSTDAGTNGVQPWAIRGPL